MTQGSPFFLLGLPRSRTRWLSTYLGCGHDLLVQCRGFDQFLGHFTKSTPLAGSVETAGMLGWKLLRERWPDCRIGLVRRPLRDVAQSLCRKNWPPDWRELELRNEVLNAIAQAPGVRSWNYSDLSCAEVGQAIWEFCHPDLPWDSERFMVLCYENIQIDLEERKKYIFTHGYALAQFKADTLLRSQGLGGLPCLGLN